MKISKAEADLLEKLRERGIDPTIMSDNIDAAAAGFNDMNKYLCPRCALTLGMILTFRQSIKM